MAVGRGALLHTLLRHIRAGPTKDVRTHFHIKPLAMMHSVEANTAFSVHSFEFWLCIAIISVMERALFVQCC